MSFKDSPKPPTALKKTKALSLDLAETETDETVSLISDSVSINSTITLENLPLNPSSWSPYPSWAGDGDLRREKRWSRAVTPAIMTIREPAAASIMVYAEVSAGDGG